MPKDPCDTIVIAEQQLATTLFLLKRIHGQITIHLMEDNRMLIRSLSVQFSYPNPLCMLAVKEWGIKAV